MKKTARSEMNFAVNMSSVEINPTAFNGRGDTVRKHDKPMQTAYMIDMLLQ